jgi:hypothetical protein
MSTNTKIILGVAVGGALLLCICVTLAAILLLQPVSSAPVLSRAFSDSVPPGNADQVAQQIAEFRLPAGYTGQYGISIGHFELAIYAESTYKGHLILMQLPPGVTADQSEMERHLREQAHDLNYVSYTRVQTISTSQRTIRGQSGTVTNSQGTNSDGEIYRLTYAIFQGKDGLAYLLIAAPLSRWNQAEADAFIDSLH